MVETVINEKALDHLFKFLENYDEINYVLSGYFKKVVTSFINGDYKTLILNYFFTRPNLADDLVKHVYCRSIAILLGNFMNFQVNEVRSFDSKKAKEEQEEEDTFRQVRVLLFRKLVNRLLASSDPEVISNISMIFEEFLKNCGDITESQAIFEGIFFDKNTLDTFFKIIYMSGRSSQSNSKSAAICQILQKALSTLTEKREKTDNNYDIEKAYFEKKLDESSNDLTQIIIDNIEKLIETIKHNLEETQGFTYTVNCGIEIKRLGIVNVNLISLIHSFLQLDNEKVNTAIGLSELFPFLCHVFEQYPWNNVFHCSF